MPPTTRRPKQAHFDAHKRSALSKLAEADKSPKGSLDAPIAPLVRLACGGGSARAAASPGHVLVRTCAQVHTLNRHRDYVTTSSCSGRVALFESPVHGRTAGRWLLVEHRTVTAEELSAALVGASAPTDPAAATGANGDGRGASQFSQLGGTLITFKLEAPILHVQCRNLESATRLLSVAVRSGFRESGIVLSSSTKVMLGIRTTANTMELPFAQRPAADPITAGGAPADNAAAARLLFPATYVAFLAEHSAAKFEANQRRTEALLAAFLEEEERVQCGECDTVQSAGAPAVAEARSGGDAGTHIQEGSLGREAAQRASRNRGLD
jgi:tRNA wybutosine-synthesizing protein 3